MLEVTIALVMFLWVSGLFRNFFDFLWENKFNMSIINKFKDWRAEKLRQKAERERIADELAEKRRKLEEEFNSTFLEQTKTFVPKSDYPRQALYRHAWRRAYVYLEFSLSEEDKYKYNFFKTIAENKYFNVSNYRSIKITKGQFNTICRQEFPERCKKLNIPEKIKNKSSKFGWIYLGHDRKLNKFYVGQTIKQVPAQRHVEHEKNRTGPCKFSELTQIAWCNLEKVPSTELDSREAYWIGYYNSFKNGFNETRGNDLKSYHKGLKEFKKNNA